MTREPRKSLGPVPKFLLSRRRRVSTMMMRPVSIARTLLTSSALQNVASGIAARILPGLASLVAVPVLIHVLGPARYAAIGLFLTIQALCGLLDIGLSTGATRQAAWLTGEKAGPERFSSLLRSFEIPYFAIAAAIVVVGTLIGAPILAAAFHFDPKTLELGQLEIFFMFATIACRFTFSLYIAYLSGRGRINLANLIYLIVELLRILGALTVVLWVGPLLSVFFGWQLLLGVAAMATVYFASWHITPTGLARIVPDWHSMLAIRGVVLGAGKVTGLFILTNSLDKLLLARFVSAADFGFYVATGQLAFALFMIVQPVAAALQPRLLTAFAADDFATARRWFLTAAGLMTALYCAFIVAAMIATPAILTLWIGAAAPRFEVVFIALSAGFGLAGLSNLTLTIHQAAARYFPTPSIFAAAIIIIPLIAYFILDRIDVTAVGLIWLAIYAIQFLSAVLTFKLYEPRLLAPWMVHVLCPLVIALAAGLVASSWTHSLSQPLQWALAFAGAPLAALLVIIANPSTRDWMRHNLGLELP